MKKTCLFLLFITFFIVIPYPVQCQFFNAVNMDDPGIISKNKSIAFWRIIIKDRTNYFHNLHLSDYKKKNYQNHKVNDNPKYNIEHRNYYYFPKFEIYKHGENNNMSEPVLNPNNFRHQSEYTKLKWKHDKTDSFSVLDELIITTARQNKYFMDRIQFLLAEKTTGSYNNTIKTKNWYNIKAEREFTIDDGQCIYLGRIEIVIKNFDEDPNE